MKRVLEVLLEEMHQQDAIDVILEKVETSRLLTEVSQFMDLGEYLGEWDKDDLAEFIVSHHTTLVIDKVLEDYLGRFIQRINGLDADTKTKLLIALGGAEPVKPIVRLYADGSVEITIPQATIVDSRA